MKRPFSLSPRLQAAAQLVPAGAKLVDVGTDHGQLPVWLIQHNIVTQALATDLRPGPLSRAEGLAARWGIGPELSFRLCDGLTSVAPQEAPVVTICGMGGETIADILHAAAWTREPGHLYILQPMTGSDGLRRYLSGNGFVVRREVLVEEGRTLYVILLAESGSMAPYTLGEIWVGRQEPSMESPLRGRYLSQELQKLRWAVEGLSRSQRPEDGEKLKEYNAAAREVAQMKKEWEAWQQ